MAQQQRMRSCSLPRPASMPSCIRSIAGPIGPTARAAAAAPAALHVAAGAPSSTAQRREISHPRRVVASATSGDAVQVQQRQKAPLPPLPPLEDPSYDGRHTFSTFSNWLLPGLVMMGRYPFVEPSRCPSREQGEWQLQQILEAGVTTFCCLQLRLVGKNGFMPYKSTAELIQCSLNGPPPSEIVNGLRNPTLNKFLPAKKQAPPSGYNPKQLHFLHHPIVGDDGELSPERMGTLLAGLRRRLEAGEKLYVHSWGGRGRAGMLGACLLAELYGVGADEAVERVQRAFRTRGPGGGGASDCQLLETVEQLDAVRQYIDSNCSGAAN